MVLTLLLRAVPLSPISLVNLDASNAIQPPAIAIQPSILTIPSKTLYLLANPMLIFFMFFTQSILPSNRSPLLSALCVSAFSFLPPGCHPACPLSAAEGSVAKDLLFVFLLSAPSASTDLIPVLLCLSTFQPSNLPTRNRLSFPAFPSLTPLQSAFPQNASVTPVECAVSKHRT